MPTVSLKRDELFAALNQTFTDEEFDRLCFAYGIELDEVTSQKEIIEKEQGKEAAKNASAEVIYKIEVPANRYDLLCLEGIARSLRVYLQKEEAPNFRLVTPASNILRMTSKEEVLGVRPYVVCAVLRNITFNAARYESFIELQEKLHQNICRRRTLVSVGTHDLDTIKGPFTYEARKPEDISFVPLNSTKLLNGHELMEELKETHLKPYLHIIKDAPRYPVIYDSQGIVLSLPPIINGDHSKIKLTTKNVFIEVTATDLTKAKIVLNMMVTMFSEYCSDKYTVEPVETVDASGHVALYPDLNEIEQTASVDYITSSIGVQLSPQQITTILKKMGLRARLTKGDSEVAVLVPPTRSDILHACDIMEDVAIAYGFDNIQPTVPATCTVGRQQPLNKFTDLLRHEMAQAGFTEILTMSLCSTKENFDLLNRQDDNSAVRISKPKTPEFEVGRTTLLVGLLKTLASNKEQALPIKIFEISDVLVKDASTDVGATNRRHLCAVFLNTASGFEVIHGVLDRVMLVLGVKQTKDGGYYIQPSDDPAFFGGRRADVIWHGEKIGVFGILHPQVIKNFDLAYPCSALELHIEPFLRAKLSSVASSSSSSSCKAGAVEVVA